MPLEQETKIDEVVEKLSKRIEARVVVSLWEGL